MKIEIIQGPWTKADAETVISMRMAIFKEWPYLYVGDRKTEVEYITPYVKSSNSCLVIAKKEGKIVGLVTGLPLAEMDEYFTAPFTQASIPIQSIFYLGEILLLKEFRGARIGYQMYKSFEDRVREWPRFTDIAILRMQYSQNSPKKPKDYKPLDEFWKRLGYVENSNLFLNISYQEIGDETKTNHPFFYSLKSLLPGKDLK